MANIKDVARHAGVSITTVSRVINNIDPVNPETRQAVEQAMMELNYVPNQLARGMRTKRTHTIGVIIPEFINSFYHELFQYIEEEAASVGYTMLVCSTREHTEQGIHQIKDLVSRKIDGIILCTYRGDDSLLTYLEQVAKTIPVIFLDNLGHEYAVNTIYTDGFIAVSEMVFHLAGLGYSNIGFIKGLEQYSAANDRFAGFMDGMEKNTLKIDTKNIFEGDYSLKSGYKAASYFMEQCPKAPDAIIASSDLMAIGVMNYLLSKGIRIPQDIAVAGYDDISLARLMIPSLTTIAQPIRKIAKEALGLIINRKEQKGLKDKKNIILKGELRIRHSTDPTKPNVVDLGSTE